MMVPFETEIIEKKQSSHSKVSLRGEVTEMEKDLSYNYRVGSGLYLDICTRGLTAHAQKVAHVKAITIGKNVCYSRGCCQQF